MRLPRIVKILFLLCFLLLTTPILAFEQYITFEDDVEVTASITEDTFSTVDVLPNVVDVKESAIVTVTVKGGVFEALPGHYIELVANGLIFNQPSQPSNSQGQVTVSVYANTPGAYNICANDITYPDLVINIIDCTTLYVTPVTSPSLISEPMYTPGNSNTLFWNSVGSNYQYYIEVSLYNNFNTIKQSSGWLAGTMFEFSNLANGSMYFYRVKARNSYGGESDWSGVEFSVQDSESPTIELISVSGLGENNTVEWESGYGVEFVYKVEDNLSLDSTDFFCVKRDSSKYSCGDTTKNGSIYTTVLRLSELEKDGIAHLFLEYEFCVEAVDTVSNEAQLCGIQLLIPEWSEPGEPVEPDEPKPPPPIVTFIDKVVDDVVDTTEFILEGLFGDLNEYELENINTTTTIVTLLVGLGTLLGGLLYIPIYLFELLLSFLSWLGLRKKGKLSGYVYDSDSKEPIPQAVVRTYNLEGKLIWTDVTDNRGFFNLALRDGVYKLEASSNKYSFPSKVIFGKADYPLENVYHGEEFTIKNGIVPEFSIPMDSIDLNWFRRLLITANSRTRVLFKVLSVILFLFGLIFSVYTYHINSNIFNFLIIVLYIPSFLLVTKALFKKGLEYGVVKNEEGEVLSDVAVGLRDVEYKRIVAKRITDGKGRYRFIVDMGVYNIEVLDTEYEVVSIEKKDVKHLSDGSVLIALDVLVKRIVVEK